MDPFIILFNIGDWFKDALFGGVISDINLILLGFKLVVLLFIVSFVRSRFGGGPIVTILVLILGYILLFQNWWVFGPMMFIYLFIVFGFSYMLLDFAIAKPWRKMSHGEGGGKPDMTGREAMEREKNIRKRMTK